MRAGALLWLAELMEGRRGMICLLAYSMCANEREGAVPAGSKAL